MFYYVINCTLRSMRYQILYHSQCLVDKTPVLPGLTQSCPQNIHNHLTFSA
uniref:Uncharacterized protein n=1 Tax=Rhizophora mucronata TaxID=61149 RepID=A0A2P2L1P6_RHIMU